MQEINANWLLTGIGEMTKNEQHVGDISNSNVVGVNVNGGSVNNYTEEYCALLNIVEKYQKQTEKFQGQIDRLITILEQNI